MLRMVINPAGMNFFPVAYFFPKKMSRITRQISATSGGRMPVADRISGMAKASEAMSDALLFAFTKPITPPAISMAINTQSIVKSICGARLV